MPGRAIQQSDFAAATGRCGAERHCLDTPQLLSVTCHHIGVGTAANKGGCATASRSKSQQPPTGLEAKETALRKRCGWCCIGPGENDKRYRHHQPTSSPKEACRYLSLRILTIQSGIIARNPITTTDATLIGARMCVHVLFHRICTWRGRWGVPQCKISF